MVLTLSGLGVRDVFRKTVPWHDLSQLFKLGFNLESTTTTMESIESSSLTIRHLCLPQFI